MLSIVAPAFNEEAVLKYFINQVCDSLKDVTDWELIIVNDGSTDQTSKILSAEAEIRSQLVVIHHEVNRGLGKALQTGFKHARGDIVITMDADGSHDPKIIPIMCQNIRAGYDVVIASRYVWGGGMEEVPYWRQFLSIIGNRVLGTLLKWPVKDATSGYRAYTNEVLGRLTELPAGFEVQSVILNQIGKAKYKEIPLVLHNRYAGYSKMSYRRLIPVYLKMLTEH